MEEGDDQLSTVSVEVPFQQEEQRSIIIQMAPPATVQPPLDDPKAAKVKKRRHCAVPNCNYSTPFSKDLARHMRKHTGEKPYACDRCSKSYSRYDKLVVHIRVHEGNRPFKCNSCEYSAVDSGALRKHQRTHSDERPYKCQLCPYAAKDSSQLVVHLRSHTRDSPYFCMDDGCDAAFKTPSDLQRHSRIHTGEKPYPCPQCSYRAAVKSNLNAHLKKHHLKGDSTAKPVIPSSELKTNFEMREENGIASCIQYNEADLSKVDPFPSTGAQESIVLMDESGVEVNVPPPKPEVLTPNRKSTKLLRPEETGPSLPFQYACKQCPHKADTIKLFAAHMKKIHDDSEGSVKLLRSKFGGRKVGRPRPVRRTKGSQVPVSGSELERFYDCSICSASFVREDSLRCHMRQHSSDPVQSIPKPKPTPLQPNDENESTVLYTYPTFCYQATSSSELDELSLETSDIQEGGEPHPPSVITENPGVITTSSVPSPHQIYIISPGGSLQSIERNNYVIH